MILVDTSVWIDHFRRGDKEFARILESGLAMTHPFVIGELACGFLPRRDEILSMLNDLPKALVAEDAEVLAMIERDRLMGKGLGYIDMHLLAAARLSDAMLWTKDARLSDVCRSIGVSYSV